ncbi:MAG TPA: ATP synthase F1 subunit epsilon [Acidobacteriota bacterium]|nr:ATP synthase F1 subunit epsilon [Acidobacteriota bacterium]
MAENKIRLEIVTPKRQFFSGEVEEVSVPGIEGYMGILPGHAPLLSELKTGVISYREGTRTTRLYSGWGFVEVLPDLVSVLCEEAALPDDIDVEKARKDKSRAQELLASKDPETDYNQALQMLQHAEARLDAAQH